MFPTAVCPRRLPQEMSSFSPTLKTASRQNISLCTGVHSMTDSCTICESYVVFTSEKSQPRNCSVYRKDTTNLKNEPNQPVCFSTYNEYNKMCVVDQCSSNKESDDFTCKCVTEQSSLCNIISKVYLYSNECFKTLNISTITKDHLDKILLLSIIPRTDTKWWNHVWNTVLVTIIGILCISVCNVDSSQCAVGLKTPGWTWPHGDIVLEYGQPLKILCILNKTFIDNSFPGKNASDLVFFRNMEEMEPEYITIINETTISMYIEKPPPAEYMFYCKLRLPNNNDKQHEAVCLNKVVIGFKPQKPNNFSCVSYNWKNMVCSWDPVHNYVTTTYSLVFKLSGRSGGRKSYPCPKESEENQKLQNTCLWDASTNPIYRQLYDYYLFTLKIKNVLGNINVTYKFHHYAHVIPEKPENLSIVNKTSDSALLHWIVPFPMDTFPPGLHHRITYQNQWDHQKSWQIINITNDVKVSKWYYNLTGLKYANSVYDVRVYSKSAIAVGEDKWSKFSDVTFRTSPRLPALSPKTDIGSFEITENIANRDVYLYWQAIPQYLENGDNFKYQIDHVEENGRKLIILPNETTRTYAKFKGISFNSYRFEIVTTNVVGMSKERAKIVVPSKFEIPREPIAFTKIAFDGGLYELSWKPPNMNTEIINYTIFWCDNERDRPYQCTGYLDWVHVPRNTTIYSMTVPDAKKVYQFAISANTHKGSSGMVWASCTVIHNKVVGKMKSVWINKIGSDFIEVGWKLDCSDRVGIVEGFNIYYCPIISPYDLNCKGVKLHNTIKGDSDTIHGVINNLKPYTTYMLAVAVLTKSGEGLHSDPLYNTTLEAAPTTPPQDVKIVNVTNTTMFITWKPPEAMNGVLRYYKVYYNGIEQKVEEDNHIELKDLLAHKNYSVNVAACTVSCSVKSPTIYKITEIGVPGVIHAPFVRFVNSSQVIVLWNKPQNSSGPLDYYEISSSDGEIQNSTKTEAQLSIPDCTTVRQDGLNQFRVRAVNIAPDNTRLKGPWSEPGEGNCYSNGPSFGVRIVIWVIGSLSGVAFLFCLAYSSKRMWLKCKAMRDVEVKLPPGLAPNMKLLQKVGEQHIRQSSADSSGCSSGQESVTSSLTSDSQVSSDSGTEIDPIPISPNKLLETLPTWESSSLRQRNVGVTRPVLTTETTRWDPYVKVAKSEEPIMADTLSLARSTPNLTDSTGYTTSQHTWSSTGYISMPSSEDLSCNPSPVPKETSATSGYSVIEGVPKSNQCKSEENTNPKESIDDTMMCIKEENKQSNSYVTLASLEQKAKDKKFTDSFRNFDDLTFVESNLSNLEPITPLSTSDEISKSYVQTGLMDSFKKPCIVNSVDSMRASLMQTSFAPTSLTDSCKKPFVSSFASPTTLTQSLTESSSKPYVTISSISELTKPPNVTSNSLDLSQKLHSSHNTASDGVSKPYVLAASVFQMLQQQSGKSDTSTVNIDDNKSDDSQASLYWQSERLKQNTALDADKVSIVPNPNSGYVTIAENPKLDQQLPPTTSTPCVHHERFEKPLTQNTIGQSLDEQYSKVTGVPSTIQ